MKKTVFYVKSLTCPTCVKKIESAIQRLDGVDTVNVFFNTEKVRVAYDPMKTKAETVAQAIEKLGYPVAKTKES